MFLYRLSFKIRRVLVLWTWVNGDSASGLLHLLLVIPYADWRCESSNCSTCQRSELVLHLRWQLSPHACRIWLDTSSGIGAIFSWRIHFLHLGFNVIKLILLKFHSLSHILVVNRFALLDFLHHIGSHELLLHGLFLHLEYMVSSFLLIHLVQLLRQFLLVLGRSIRVSHCLRLSTLVLLKWWWCTT